MKLGKTLYVTERNAWRDWLASNHDKEDEIWLIFYKKGTGKPRLPYDDAVEEALCFGWIDSIIKRIDQESNAQRFTPRRPNSQLSEMNKERIRRLIKVGKMTPAGLLAVEVLITEDFTIPEDILNVLKANGHTWSNFQEFPESYRRIRIGWIEAARKRPLEFNKRLEYFIKMTALNKMYGMVR